MQTDNINNELPLLLNKTARKKVDAKIDSIIDLKASGYSTGQVSDNH